MKLSVSHYDGNKLQLLAPLEPNVNHQMTAFGGSLLSGCALVGWGLLQLQLGHMDRLGNVVVGEATSTFYAPLRISCASRVSCSRNSVISSKTC